MTIGESETFIRTLSGFTHTLQLFVVFYQYSCEGTLMNVAVEKEIWR